ncbi:MAG: NAD-dependent epimerase/dehydratase family protein [Gammaproteobacteria bacterium]
MKFTVFGGHGFIGSALCNYLTAMGHQVFVPRRDGSDVRGLELGHVIYAIGLTADYRSRPFDTVEAHVAALSRHLRDASYRSWLYLSSTRVYEGQTAEPVSEEVSLVVNPGSHGIYNLSKLTGEALCLSLPSAAVRIVRLSNVFGREQPKETFLGMLLDDLAKGHELVIGEAAASSKDYIAIEDVCWLLVRIALDGRQRIYNVASGKPISHGELATVLSELSGCRVRFSDNAPRRAFPRIDISRVIGEFGFRPKCLLGNLRDMIPRSSTSTIGL